MIKAYTIKNGTIVEMANSDVGPAGVSAGKVIKKALKAIADGASWAQVRDWAVEKAKIAVVNWPEPAEGKERVEYYRLATDDLTGMPTPRLTIGPAVFAYEEVDIAPRPVPVRVSARQFIEWLALNGKISVAQLISWHTSGALPPPIVQGLTNYSGTNAVKARWVNQFIRETVFYRGDQQGSFIPILKEVFGMTDAELDTAFFEAEEL